MTIMKQLPALCAYLLLVIALPACAGFVSGEWPPVTTQAKPHAYWWWMGSAVDTNNITKELTRYHDAGMGGVHIIPIYGAKGWESKYIPYLSPEWMEMLDYTVTEARRLGMEVDMTTGTGWCFGGPEVTDEEANAVMVSDVWRVAAGGRIPLKFGRAKTQALMAFGPDGKKEDLLGKIGTDGSVNWTAHEGKWTVYAISQKPASQKVKRAAPGGQGWMLNLAYPEAMTNYLRWMDEGFANYTGARPRAQYHDSYEYKMDWSPVLLDEFEKRRGYRLQDHLDAFITGKPAERAARVKCDYRETISDIMVGEMIPQWVNWAHERGYITRNEAHGSPGNWLDLYAAADIPETEMFYKDRNILISKFASSAAHVSGKNLVSAETGTWLKEHFTETLADMKYLLDDLFLSGVNHVFYHGTCYSPDEVPWPGWVFYASYEMNPRNAIWHDVGALNAYATRCQSVLQAGQSCNDILLYWPIHDFWTDPEGTTRNLTVHARDWFEQQPIGRVAKELWESGYAFDYVSDRQLQTATVVNGQVRMTGGEYRVVVVPECQVIKGETFQQLLKLARAGATVIFEKQLPEDLSGNYSTVTQRKKFRQQRSELLAIHRDSISGPNYGEGTVFSGVLSANLWKAGVGRDKLVDAGLSFISRKLSDGRFYFIANRSDKLVNGWVPLGTQAKSVSLLDPLTGHVYFPKFREGGSVPVEVKLTLPAGASAILRAYDSTNVQGCASPQYMESGSAVQLKGKWRVRFSNGGPVIPAPFTVDRLASWTESGDTNAQSFAGTAVYSLRFNRPDEIDSQAAQIDLGMVCQSARFRLNGKNYGVFFTAPFRVVVTNLEEKDNVLEVEVTNTSANRIRDLDRRRVQWQIFHDINFVNLNYKKFNAADWPLSDSGLLGPVTLTPVCPAE